MKNKHTVEEFMLWRRENLERLATSLSIHLDMKQVNWTEFSDKQLAIQCVDFCYRMDALEVKNTPIEIVTEQGGRVIDTAKLALSYPKEMGEYS